VVLSAKTIDYMFDPV